VPAFVNENLYAFCEEGTTFKGIFTRTSGVMGFSIYNVRFVPLKKYIFLITPCPLRGASQIFLMQIHIHNFNVLPILNHAKLSLLDHPYMH
jgi:hypothetical protein